MGVARKELIEAAMLDCRRRLEALGFTRHEADVYTLPLAPRVFGWAALGRGVRRGDGSMDVTPFVGILHQDVERIVAACTHLPYSRYDPPTVSMNVGQLTPDAAAVHVVFYPQEPVDEPAERVCQPIGEYGIPWMREHASLAAIYDLLIGGRFVIAVLSSFKPPVVAWMLGRPDLARQLVRERLDQIAQGARPHAAGPLKAILERIAESADREVAGRNRARALEVYGRFAAALEERMVQGPWRPPHGK